MLRAVPFLLLMVLQDVTSMESISELMKKHPTWSFELESVESMVKKGTASLRKMHPEMEVTEEMVREKLRNHIEPGATHIIRKTGDTRWPTVVPQTFDIRDKYKECAHLFSDIDDEGACFTDAHVVVSAIATDRYCIFTNGTYKEKLSSEYHAGCSVFCTKSPNIWPAWKNAVQVGTPTGGKHQSNSGCLPYEHAPCKHTITQYISSPKHKQEMKVHKKGKVKPCDQEMPYDHDCATKCTNKKYKTPLEKDFKKFTTYYFTSTNEYQIRSEIFANGPVVSSIIMYSDWFDHKKGWYWKGGNTTIVAWDKYFKIIGWGKEEVGNQTLPYWLAVNSWDNWADGKIFKILRGVNYIWSEWVVTAGTYDPL
nr:PREDICTED: cathepsin B-like cysteine proteinase 4 [Bemisia tabaci]